MQLGQVVVILLARNHAGLHQTQIAIDHYPIVGRGCFVARDNIVSLTHRGHGFQQIRFGRTKLGLQRTRIDREEHGALLNFLPRYESDAH